MKLILLRSIVFLCILFENIDASDSSIIYSYQFGTGYGNREELVITNVSTNENFELGRGVFKWKSISIREKNYAVGLMSKGVTLLTLEKTDTNITKEENIVELEGTPTELELFKHWNRKTRTYEIFLVIAVIAEHHELEWYKIEENRTLEKVWTWHLHKKVININIFKIESICNLLIISDNLENRTTADLYQFVLSERNFWLMQTIRFDNPAQYSAINTYGQYHYLSIPQNQSEVVRIYKYTDDRFTPFKNLSSGHVNFVASFNIGYKSYLAIDGYSAGIYEFSRHGLVKENLKHTILDGITFWLPVPVSNYREEVILLAQRSLDHDSHKSITIEAVLSNGGEFSLHEEMPCCYYGEVSNGMNCIVEETIHSRGINGSAVIATEGLLGIIVPRHEGTSIFFVFDTAMRKLPSPVEVQVEKLIATRKKLEKMIEDRKASINRIRNRHDKAVKLTEANRIVSPWKAKTLGKAVPASNRPDSPDLGKSERNSQEEADLPTFENQVNNIEASLNYIRSKLQDAVPADESVIKFKNLVLNGLVRVERDSKIEKVQTDNFNDEPADDVFKDIVRKDYIKPIHSYKTFSNLEVENLNFETVNGINSGHLIFQDEPRIEITGNLVFDKPLNVIGDVEVSSGKVNDVNLEEELIEVGKHYEDELQFESVIVLDTLNVGKMNKFPIHSNYVAALEDNGNENLVVQDDGFKTLYIPGNVTVENINGENFNNILEKLCLRNVRTRIPGDTLITEDLRISTSADINYLNGLKFPEQYVLRNASKFTEIYGKKSFENTIHAKEVLTPGLINGIDTAHIVTLSENQTIPGNFTFADLEVAESVDKIGNITGKHIEDFLPNPTLEESNILKASVNFNTLEVDGIITTGTYFNGSHFKNLLDDVVYKNEEVQTIDSIKEFPYGLSVTNNIMVASSSINSIPLDTFITKDTEQILALKTLNGNVTFENLNLVGLFGDINITRLGQETVRLTGEQYISASLIFEDDIIATTLEIQGSLNDLAPEEYVYTTGDREFPILSSLEDVKVEYVTVEGDFNAEIDNFDIDDFERRRLSLTEDQVITGDLDVKNASVANIKVEKINGYMYEDVFTLEKYQDLITQMLLENKLTIKELNITGNLTIESINNVEMENIMKSCAYLEEDKLQPDVNFRDIVTFSSIEIEKFNGYNFSDFLRNLVFRNETSLHVNGFKAFLNGLEVRNFIDITLLNDIRLEYILRKTGYQEIAGPLIIQGNVVIDSDAQVLEYLNDVPVQYLTDTFEVVGGSYKINGDVFFERLAYIDDLVIEGFVNGENFTDFLLNIVSVNDDVNIIGTTTFAEDVTVKGNMSVTSKINDIDLSEFIDEVVLTTQDDYVEGLVTFAQPVNIQEELLIESDLLSRYVMGIDLQSWKDNAVYVNEGLIPGAVSFESVTIRDFVKTDFLNTVNMSSLIPLRTEQHIPRSLYIEQISAFHDIVVDNLVNGVKLEPEVYNSVMNGADREILSQIKFEGNVVIRENAHMLGPVNGLDFSKVVTTCTDQNLTAQYDFIGKITMVLHLNVYGLVNGISMTEWAINSIRKSAPYSQNIVEPWEVEGNMTFANNAVGSGLISGLDVSQMVDVVENKRQYKFAVERGLIADYDKVCSDVDYLVRAAKSQIYKFKYLENMQEMNFQNSVDNVHHFTHAEIDYLLVNEENSCKASLFSWDKSKFNLITHQETGRMSQFITVHEGNSSYLVGRSSLQASPCAIEGTNVWIIETDSNLLHIFKIENQLLLQESQIPGTFYGLGEKHVLEYKIKSNPEPVIRKYRKWDISAGNFAFVPRGFQMGLALRNGLEITKLLREEPVVDEEFGYDVEASLIGNVLRERNSYLPGMNGGDVAVLNVGKPRRKALVAVATHEETSVKGRLDFIKIYDDITTGKLYHKVSTYKPSSLISMEFGNNGETLLTFLEDQRTLQVYEYKGIEGFKHRSSAKIAGQKLMLTQLPTDSNRPLRLPILIAINKGQLNVFGAVMDGDVIELENLNCVL